MSEPTEPTPPADPNGWTRAHHGEPPPAIPPTPTPPKPFPRAAVFGGLAGAAVGVLAVVALSVWGGVVGRVIVAAVGFGVAGAVLPWTFAAVNSSLDNTAGCILGWLSVLCAVIGLVVGVFFGMGSEKLEWWAYAGSGTAAALAGGVAGGMGAERWVKGKG